MASSTNPMKKSPLNTATCPLCGRPNQCVLAADPSATECWCDAVEFPKELLEKIPKNAERKTCVCQRCLEKYQGSLNISVKTS